MTKPTGNGPSPPARSGSEPKAKSKVKAKIDDRLIREIGSRLDDNLRVRRNLPDGGRINVDRQLPFLILYRPPFDSSDEGTKRFVQTEASYLIAPRGRRYRPKTRELGLSVVSRLAEVFGGFLVIELWAGPETVASPDDDSPASPSFRVVTPRSFAQSSTIEELVDELGRVTLFKQRAEVEVVAGGRMAAKGQNPLATAAEMHDLNAKVIGIEVAPVYRDPDSGETYPIALRQIARRVSRALRQTCFEFARTETSARPRHYQSLGTRAFTRAVRDVDAGLAALASTFDVLLYVTPTNGASAFKDFKASGFETVPDLFYRPRDLDLNAMKRRLHSIDTERVDDPTLGYIFREKKEEIDLQLSLLMDRDTDRALPLSLALFGRVDDELVATAEKLLAAFPSGSDTTRKSVSAKWMVQRAHEELDGYRQAYPPFDTEVHLRDELTSLMVSGGQLLIGTNMMFLPTRVEPLLQHEVGTHVVTHWNGQAQPLKLLSTGLAGYDELQEGLAVFAEFLAAGLTPTRMRTLAGRVVAAHLLIGGASFVETFRQLRERFGFSDVGAWHIVLRVYRGGGYVKDSVYLRGLQSVLDYLAAGGHLETLLVGKIAIEHAPFIEELQRRRVLNPSPLRPAYLDDPDGQERLDRARRGLSLADLVET
jgi:uncharacterized protein (TIGR02421 family)